MKTKILLIAGLLILTSCSFFRVIPKSTYTAQSIKQYDDDGKYLVLHRGEEAWHAYDLNFKDDSLLSKLDFQLGYHINYLDPKEKGLNTYKRRTQPEVGNSLHIFTNDTTFGAFDTQVSIPISSIYKVILYEYARAPSRASRIVPAIFAPIVGIVVISAIALLIDPISFED